MKKDGYEILEQNFRCKIGEIDIIAKQENILSFVEVKYRSTTRYGYAGEAVNYRKQNKIYKCAQVYKIIKRIPDNIQCRFDVVVIQGQKIQLIKNAFGAI